MGTIVIDDRKYGGDGTTKMLEGEALKRFAMDKYLEKQNLYYGCWNPMDTQAESCQKQIDKLLKDVKRMNSYVSKISNLIDNLSSNKSDFSSANNQFVTGGFMISGKSFETEGGMTISTCIEYIESSIKFLVLQKDLVNITIIPHYNTLITRAEESRDLFKKKSAELQKAYREAEQQFYAKNHQYDKRIDDMQFYENGY